MKKSIRDFNLKDKKVIIRVDFNVPIKDGIITDDNRIKESLKTINYACDNGAKVILLSHLGRIKEEADKEKNSLLPVSERLSKLVNHKVLFCPVTRGKKLEDMVSSLENGDILLVENTRYEDLDGKKESSNDEELGKYWASLGDIFINDAFGTSHRAHASNVGISTYLDSGIGFLIEKELDNLESVINNPKRPFAVILGGAKVADKIGVIENLVKKADYILIGGGMSYTFLYSKGLEVGKSLLDLESVEFCKTMLKDYNDKIILPIDSVNGLSIEHGTNVNTTSVDSIPKDYIGLDIGEKTIELFKKYILDSETIVWNGPLGYSEIKEFSNGTKKLLEVLKNSKKDVIIGGGDTASAAINFGYKNAFKHISTGGGASLELLEGKILPGIECIKNK